MLTVWAVTVLSVIVWSFKLSAINASQKHVINLPLDPFMLLTRPVFLLFLHPFYFLLWASVSQLPVSFLSFSHIYKEKIWMYVFVLRVESKVRLPVIVSTKKQHQEAVMSALSPTLSHRRSHCPSLCMISQCCICQWRNRKREENRFPSSFHRWLACSEWDQEKERRGLWLMRHRLAGPHLSGFGSGRERERLKCEWHFQLSTPKSLENSLSFQSAAERDRNKLQQKKTQMLFSISNFRFSFHNLGMCRTAFLTLWTWCTVGTEGEKLLLRMWSQCWGRTRPRSCLEHPVVSARPSPWGKQQSSNLVPPLPQLHWLLQHCIAPWTQLSGGKGCGSAGRLSCTLRPLNVTGSAWWPRWPAGNYSTTLRCR